MDAFQNKKNNKIQNLKHELDEKELSIMKLNLTARKSFSISMSR